MPLLTSVIMAPARREVKNQTRTTPSRAKLRGFWGPVWGGFGAKKHEKTMFFLRLGRFWRRTILAKVSFGRVLEALGGLGELGGCFGMLWEALGRLWEALGRHWGGFAEAWGRLGGGLGGLGKTSGPARRPPARLYIQTPDHPPHGGRC